MITLIVLFALYLAFIVFTVYFKNKMLYIKTKWLFLFIPLYFVAIFYYYDLLTQIANFLGVKEIYIVDFGHAKILLVELLFVMYITSIVFVINIFYKRRKNARLNKSI